jgi:hypothetical protein
MTLMEMMMMMLEMMMEMMMMMMMDIGMSVGMVTGSMRCIRRSGVGGDDNNHVGDTYSSYNMLMSTVMITEM